MNIFYRNVIVVCALAAFVSVLVNKKILADSATAKRVSPIMLYGDTIKFEVIRNGEKIGTHRVQFKRHAKGWTVSNTADMQIRFLAFFSYRYKYKSEALWVDGELERLRAEVDDDGERFEMLATRTGTKMQVELVGRVYDTPAPIMPTNHWNHTVLGHVRVLNTLTGNVNKVKLVPKGQEMIFTERGDVSANRYAYTGDLEDTEVWYDDVGRWVKLRFLGRDGTPVEYVCQKCLGDG